jgi:PAS domain S-box-containing protein
MSKPIRALIIEDVEDDALLLVAELKRGGYEVVFERVDTAAAMRNALQQKAWDVILCDFTMPYFNGAAALQLAKESGADMPFIFVSGTIGEDVAIEAMKSGAQDYIMKTNLARLAPAVERELHETQVRRESRQAETAMRESEHKYRHLFEALGDAVFVIVEESGRIIDTNARAENLLGRTRTEILGSNQARLFAPQSGRPGFDILRAAANGEHPGGCELEVFRHDGRIVPVHASASRIELYDRQLLLTVLHDVSERNRMDEQLRQLSRAVEQSPASIVITDLDGNITYVNARFTEMTGYAFAEAVGKKTSLLKSGEMPAEIYEQLWQTITSGKEWRGEFHNKKKNGELYWESASISPITNEAGKTTHFLAIKEDITEKKQLAAQFLRAQRLESIGHLAGGIAHDLNNILMPILMSVEFLREEVKTEEGLSMLETLETSARRGADIVKQVLTFARGVEGRHVLLQPSHLVKETAKIIRETFPKSITLNTSLQKSSWMVSGDVTQLHQILLNLTVNARDAMPQGGTLGLAIEDVEMDADAARFIPGAKPGSYVLLKVSDTGTGIPPEIADKIFDPFFTTKGLEKGTGLGLSTVLGIVKSHGGFIQFDSQMGRGTEFRVYLPAKMEAASATGTKPPKPLPSGQGELILIVDDEEPVRQTVKRILESNGYRTLTANNGIEAIARYTEKGSQIGLVVTDMNMPGMSGPAIIAALQKLNPGVRILVATGAELANETDALKQLNVACILKKPFDATLLIESLHGILHPSRNEVPHQGDAGHA